MYGGNPELVVHQETGILVPPEDPEKLTIAINNLLDNEESRRNFALQIMLLNLLIRILAGMFY